MTTDNKPIILYPREYNLRGGDARSSVKGITHDGELVTIKLRVDGAIHTVEAIPSISSFAKTSTMESRQSCLASLDNGPQKPMGILIFIRCDLEENPRDPDKNYPVYYTSRWAYVLRTGHQPLTADFRGDLPFIGMGRVVIDKRNRQIQTAKENMARLERDQPEGWREAFARNEAIFKDYRSYDYHLYGYLTEQESIFADEDESALVSWMDKVMGHPEENAHNGILFRIEVDDGVIIKELVREVFPIYDTVFRRYQNGAELLSYFKSSNPDLNGIERFNYRVMPLIRFAGKKIFKDSLRSQADFDELEQTYYLRDEPLVMPLAVRIDRLDNKDLLINKIHKTGPSLGSPALLDISGERRLRFEGESIDAPLVFENIDNMNLMSAGLIKGGSLTLASWYSPVSIDPERVMTLLPTEGSDLLLMSAPIAIDSISTESSEFAHQIEAEPFVESELSATLVIEPKAGDTHLSDENHISGDVPVESTSVDRLDDLLEPSVEEVVEEEDQDFTQRGVSILDMAEELSTEIVATGEENAEGSSLFGSTPISFEHFSHEAEPVEQSLSEPLPEDLQESLAEIPVTVMDEPVKSVEVLEETLDPSISEQMTEEYLTSLEDILKTSDSASSQHVDSPAGNEEISSSLPAWDAVDDAVAAEQEPSDADFDAWMDDDELVEVLSESPDAYSDETEGDNPTALVSQPIEPVITSPLKPAVVITPSTETRADETTQSKPKKGGLASFVRSRQQK